MNSRFNSTCVNRRAGVKGTEKSIESDGSGSLGQEA